MQVLKLNKAKIGTLLFGAMLLLSSISRAETHDLSLYPRWTGEADDTERLRRAVAAADADKGQVYIPAGTYSVSDTITNPSQNGFTIRGDGTSSVIVQTAVGKSLFDFAYYDSLAHLTIRNIRLTTTVAGANAAIKVSIQTAGAPNQPNHFDTGLMADTVTIDASGNGSWNYGIQLSNVWNSDVNGCTITNKVGAYLGTAIAIDYDSTNSFFSANTISEWQNGILCDAAYDEGLIVDGGSITHVVEGVTHHGTGDLGYTSIQNATIDCRGAGAFGIYVQNIASVYGMFLRECSVTVGADIPNTPNPPWNEYHFYARTRFASILGNTFNGSGTTGAVVDDATAAHDVDPNIISRNTFTGIPSANGASLWIVTYNNNSTVVQNGFGGGWYLDQSAAPFTLNALNY